MTRAEIGNYLGMTLEIGEPGAVPAGAGRRDPLQREGPARHPDPARSSALTAFMQRSLAPPPWRVDGPFTSASRNDRQRSRAASSLRGCRACAAVPIPRVGVGRQQLARIARHQQHRQVAAARRAASRQFGAAHAGAERDVGQQQVDGRAAARARPTPARRWRRQTTSQPSAAGRLLHDAAHFGIVLDQQHPQACAAAAARCAALAAFAGAGTRRSAAGTASRWCRRRARCRSCDGAARLLGEAVHGGQAQAGAAPGFLGREEGLEGALLHRFGHAVRRCRRSRSRHRRRPSGALAIRAASPTGSTSQRRQANDSAPPSGIASRALIAMFSSADSSCPGSASTGRAVRAHRA